MGAPPKVARLCGRKHRIQGLRSRAGQQLPMAMLRSGEGSNRCPTLVKTGDGEHVPRALAWRAER